MTKNTIQRIYGNYIELGILGNSRFDLSHSTNRDNSNYPYWLLRNKLKKYGILLNTPDVNINMPVSFEIHMNALCRTNDYIKYALLYESSKIYKDNNNPVFLRNYRLVFTWDDDLIDNDTFLKINFSNRPLNFKELGWRHRVKLCCLIAGNHIVNKKDPDNLYWQRIKIIRWFEKNALEDFDLYGAGWDAPYANNRYTKKILALLKPFCRLYDPIYFPSYKGKVQTKFEILSTCKFVVCFENIANLKGYITEKIFDAFFSGCIPIYWGASNIHTYIPKACFIDFRDFADYASLYHFISKMSEREYIERQLEIRRYLSSDKAKEFYAENFAETVAKNVALDLGLRV